MRFTLRDDDPEGIARSRSRPHDDREPLERRVIAALTTSLSALTVFALVGSVNRASQDGDDVLEASAQCELGGPRALHELEACVAQFPRDVELSLDLGAIYESAGRPADAVPTYRRAVEADPRDADARLRLGAALGRAGDLRGARREGIAALKLRPNDPEALMLVGTDPDPSNRR